jgi:RimJ/RimL family protein N-acetyltransferase
VEGERVFLRILSPDDVSDAYVAWLSDPEVTQYLECRWRSFSKEELRAYVATMNKDEHNVLFGIFEKNAALHLGNIKIGSIDMLHRFADIGVLIGERRCWGKGYGAEAISLATRYAFEELNLNKVIAGIYAANVASLKAFLKAGFKEAGVLRQHRFCKGVYMDEIIVEKCRCS